ncbi:MAG TPA: type VI secretion system tip protein VgrG [Opitutaceae bacterium]|jgi:type VI secretion system secreted protein VgrG
MALKRSQANRSAKLTTSLGDDVLLLKGLTGVERLGRPFEYTLSLLSENREIDYKKVIGTTVTVSLDLANTKIPRYFHGVLTSLELINYEREYVEYTAIVRPTLWLLTRTSDCQIFQNKSVKDVLTQVFSDNNLTDYSWRTSATYKAQDYIVQYRESAFDFVSRLMEEAGIYYYFKHEKTKHTLVLCDSESGHDPFSNYATFPFQPYNAGTLQEEHLKTWNVRQEVQTGSFALGSFDFENTKKELRSKDTIDKSYAHSTLAFYEYPAGFTESTDGDALSKIRAQELQAGHEIFTAEGSLRGINCGSTFTLSGHPRKGFNKQYLIIGARYSIESDDYRAAGQSTEKKTAYVGGLEAIESSVPFRSERSTPKPVVQGPQTAIVVGPSGQEIYTDKYGRIKVQFHWDRTGKSDENSSCFMRVSTAWAGNKWGAFGLPRIGQEVVVSFLEGDPDEPIVTGCVYNGNNLPPYALPDAKTKSTLKSNTTTGGGGYNELRFEDNKGSEQIYLHAQKDQDNYVVNDSKEWVGNNRHLVVTKDQYEKVGQDLHEHVVRDQMTKVDRDVHLTVAGKQAAKITGKLSLTVGGDVVEVFQGAHSEVVTKDLYLKGDNVCIEAATNLTLMVGDAFIAFNSDGIKISSPKKIAIAATGDLTVDGQGVTVTAKGSLSASSNADATLSGATVSVSGKTSAEVKGGTVSISGTTSTAIKGATVMIN